MFTHSWPHSLRLKGFAQLKRHVSAHIRQHKIGLFLRQPFRLDSACKPFGTSSDKRIHDAFRRYIMRLGYVGNSQIVLQFFHQFSLVNANHLGGDCYERVILSTRVIAVAALGQGDNRADRKHCHDEENNPWFEPFAIHLVFLILWGRNPVFLLFAV
jgi:hypothetical protein